MFWLLQVRVEGETTRLYALSYKVCFIGQTDASLWYHCGVVAQLWRKGLLHKVTDVWAEGTSPCALACTLHDQWHTLIDYKVKKGVIEYARVLGAATLQRLKAMNEDDLLFPSRTLSRSPLSITRPLLCLYPEHQDGLWSSLLSFITRLDVSHSTTDRRVLVCVSYANPQPLPPIIVGDDMPAVDEADLQSMWEFASALWKASLSLLQRADENYKGWRNMSGVSLSLSLSLPLTHTHIQGPYVRWWSIRVIKWPSKIIRIMCAPK